MTRVIHSGLRAYLMVGGFWALLIIPSGAIWAIKGAENGFWKECVAASLLCLFCFALLLRYKLVVEPDGVVCRGYFGRVKRVAWTDIRRKVLIVSRDRRQNPRVLRLIGKSDALLLHIPLIFLGRSDSEYLVRDVFKVTKFG